MADAPDDPDAYDAAIAWFRDRVPLGADEYAGLIEAERAYAMTIAGVAQADLVADVYDALERAVRDGTTLEEFQAEVGDRLVAAWGGSVANPPARLETIFRTNVQSAYGRGRYRQMRAPAVKRERPYWLFDGVEDDRQSEICEPLSGTIRPADDPWWASHQPPLHFNCRSTVQALSPEEAEEEGGADDSAPRVDAQDGFGTVDDDSDAADAVDPADYPPELRDTLAERLGE